MTSEGGNLPPSPLAEKIQAVSDSGQSIIEILIAVGVGSLLVIAAAGVIAPVLKADSQAGKVQVAAALGSELSDNIRVWAEGDWHNLANLQTGPANLYYLNTSSSPYTVVTGTQSLSYPFPTVAANAYSRYFYVNPVSRDLNDNIVTTSTGSTDPSTLQVTVGYNWAQGATTTFSFYLTRYRDNVYDQTDWSGGPGSSGAATTTNNKFASSTNITYALTTGSISINLPEVGHLGSWSATNPLPLTTDRYALFAYNGYLYQVGGDVDSAEDSSQTSTVSYAPLNSSDGTVGTWTRTTPLPEPLDFLASVANNGYIYALGGDSSCCNPDNPSQVYYAKINASGTIGSWSATTQLPSSIDTFSSVVNNGYIYVIGGWPNTSAVYYAAINSSGTLGSWISTTPMPDAEYSIQGATVANGYVYFAGGANASDQHTSSVIFAPINGDGSLGSWNEASPLTTTGNAGGYAGGQLVAKGNSLYFFSEATTTMIYAPINPANGSVDTWRITTQIPAVVSLFGSAIYNGYVYIAGGEDLSTSTFATSTIIYAKTL